MPSFFTKLVFHKRMLCYFLHSVIFIDWMYCDRGGPKIPGCLSVRVCVCVSVCVCVCLCVCVCVCLFALERRNYRADFNETFQKWSLVGLYVCVWVSAHYHNWWRHGRHVGRKNEGTVTATVFIRFSWNFEYNICGDLLGLGLHFSDLRHHLLVKMAVEKTVKTGRQQ